MDDLRYILGKSIPIEGIGDLYPLTIEEYSLYGKYLNILTVTTKLLLQQIDVKDKENRSKVEKELKNFDVLCMDGRNLQTLFQLLSVSFRVGLPEIKFNTNKQEIWLGDKKRVINRNNYDFVRNMIIKINNVRLPRQAANSELQKWFDKSRKMKSKDGSQDMEDIITSVMACTGYTPDNISKMTMYQVNKLIARINKIKEFEMNIQFLCVGSNIQLEHFSGHIEEDLEDKVGTDFNEFQRDFGKVLSGNK